MRFTLSQLWRSIVLIGLSVSLIPGARVGLAQTAVPTGSPTSAPASGSAKLSTGSICVLAFADLNKNGVRDADETLLNGANIAVLIPGANGGSGSVIANHVTDDQGQSCFDSLTPGTYTLTFNDPLALSTTAPTITVNVAAGQQITRSFGALPMQAIIQDNSDRVTILLTRRNRVIIGLIGALAAMLIMIGLGLTLHNGRHVLLNRRPREPEQIR